MPEYVHETVNHSAGEYVRGSAHSNGIDVVLGAVQGRLLRDAPSHERGAGEALPSGSQRPAQHPQRGHGGADAQPGRAAVDVEDAGWPGGLRGGRLRASGQLAWGERESDAKPPRANCALRSHASGMRGIPCGKTVPQNCVFRPSNRLGDGIIPAVTPR